MSRRVFWPVALLLLLAGCSKPSPQPAAVPPPAANADAAAAAAPAGPVEVRLSADARARAGIEVGAPSRFTGASSLKLPGTVAPDAYGQLTVATLVGGQITEVPVQLGTTVHAGDVISRITSPDFADMQASYLAHRAAVAADHQRIVRLQRLVEIGAASQQDLDDANAMHTNHTSELERAKSRLRLLGVSLAALDELAGTGDVRSDYAVRAPSTGVVTRRDVNPGQVVAPQAALVQLSRLDRVWILASAYEQDLARLKAGMPARVTVRGGASEGIRAQIAYVDPQVDPATRAGQVRLEIANAQEAWRFGMLVDVDVEVPAPPGVLAVPTDAVQSVGEASVVYVQDPQRPDVLIERAVTTGAAREGVTAIASGLSAQDRVVVHGAFAVRSERLRVAPLTPGPSSPGRPRSQGRG
ncbi:MAG TPA: efflux RND transporter periplasmic adaptor subunit [Vicinamibacterales bacterium]|nr:efflux RND transporter periplasmic adaptor subunit [Vicinamibacterales bacterium]